MSARTCPAPCLGWLTGALGERGSGIVAPVLVEVVGGPSIAVSIVENGVQYVAVFGECNDVQRKVTVTSEGCVLPD